MLGVAAATNEGNLEAVCLKRAASVRLEARRDGLRPPLADTEDETYEQISPHTCSETPSLHTCARTGPMGGGWGAPAAGPVPKPPPPLTPRQLLRLSGPLALLLLLLAGLAQRCQGVGTAAAAGGQHHRRHHRHHPQLLRGADDKEAAWLQHCVDVSTHLVRPGRSVGVARSVGRGRRNAPLPVGGDGGRRVHVKGAVDSADVYAGAAVPAVGWRCCSQSPHGGRPRRRRSAKGRKPERHRPHHNNRARHTRSITYLLVPDPRTTHTRD